MLYKGSNFLISQGFLVKPLQRLCKYPLLIRELLKDTPENHVDRKDLLAFETKIKVGEHCFARVDCAKCMRCNIIGFGATYKRANP